MGLLSLPHVSPTLQCLQRDFHRVRDLCTEALACFSDFTRMDFFDGLVSLAASVFLTPVHFSLNTAWMSCGSSVDFFPSCELQSSPHFDLPPSFFHHLLVRLQKCFCMALLQQLSILEPQGTLPALSTLLTFAFEY